MSGLLRRLAEHTLNQGGPAIHSQARMPYAAPFEFAQSHEPAAGVFTHRADSLQASAKGGASGPADPSLVKTRAYSAIPASETSLNESGDGPLFEPQIRETTIGTLETYSQPHRKAMPESVMRTQSAAPKKPLPESSAEFQGEPSATVDFNRLSAPHPMQYREKGVPSMVADDSVRRQEQAFFPTGQLFDTESNDADRTPFTEAESGAARLPARLVSPFHAQSSEASVRPGPYQESLRQPANAKETEVNEVHVHIGRIEVTAVHEKPVSKPSAIPARRQPMSLDEYLAKRQGGAA